MELEIFDRIPVKYVLLSNVVLLLVWKFISFIEKDPYGVGTLISCGLFFICCCVSIYKIVKFIETLTKGDTTEQSDNHIEQNEQINEKNPEES